jgi:DNA-binding SARP family transcriptional activator
MPGVTDLKLRRPDAHGLVRPRLLTPLLDESGPGIVVVVAPAGSGKTTLLARAASVAERTGQRPAWCPLGPEDRSGPAFLARLARSLALACGADLAAPRDVPELLDAVMGTGVTRLAVYVDDAHELEGGTGQQQLEELVRWRPEEVRLLVGTRRPLSVNTPRLMVSGELAELDAESLRFRSWEVEELFRLVYGEPLLPESAAALTRRTGGWAAGLKLFHLATSGKPASERQRAVSELGGRSRLVRSYLTRTVLEELEPELRDFLLVTSTLGTLTGPLCDALMDREGSAVVLEDLAARQFLLVAAEDGSSFRYHQVMQTLLEGLLVDEVGTRGATRVYARSGALLEADDRPVDAARAYALAGDHASVARLVQRSGPSLATGRIALAGPADDPWLALVEARRLHRSGAVAASVAAFRRAEALHDDADFRRRCQEERAEVAWWLPEAPHGDLASARPRRLSTAQAVRRLTRRADLDGELPPLAADVARLLHGHRTPLTTAAAPRATQSDFERLAGDLLAVLAEIGDGTWSHVLGRLEEIVLTAELQDQPWLARVGRGLQAAVLRADTEQAWRTQSCAALVEECEAAGDRWGAALLALATGAAVATRHDRGALAWLDRAAHGASALDAPVLGAWAAVLGAEAARSLGEPDAEMRSIAGSRAARACGLGRIEDTVRGWFDVPVATSTPSGIVLRCLGTFEIEVEGRVLTLTGLRPLPRTLLLILALHHDQDVHREDLIEALWPDVSVEAATHRLHAAASSVRRALAGTAGLEDAVLRHGGAYRLRLSHAEVDVARFEEAARRAAQHAAQGDEEEALRWGLAALDRYAGDLLPEVGPQEWVVTERARLRVAAAEMAYAAGRSGLRTRRLDEALHAAHRATDLDPLRDSAWGLLAEVQTAMGDVTAAAATRRRQAEVSAETTAGASAGLTLR